ncbi:hypothetical protein JXI42_12355 [bacterium]|nr:hypothetical protein [bacterium]
MKNLKICFCFLLIVFIFTHVYSQVPRTMNYQGKLTDPDGIALNGNIGIQFSVFDTLIGSSPIWAETLTVSVSNGLFDVVLGKIHPIKLDFRNQYYMELTLEGETMAPRCSFNPVAYSYRSFYSDTADYAFNSPFTMGNRPTASLAHNIDVCADETLSLDIHYYGGVLPYTHSWSGDTSPLSAVNISNPEFLTSTPGSYQLLYTLTDDSSNESSVQVTVKVHGNPTPIILADPVTGWCEGSTVILNAGGCYSQYCWSPDGSSTRINMVDSAGNYTVTVTDAYGCSGTDEITITYFPSPTADAGTNIDICENAPNQVVGGSPTAAGGVPPYTYIWTGSGAIYLSSTAASNPSFNVAAANPGFYSLSVEVTDDNGCAGIGGPMIVTIHPSPNSTPFSNSPVCENQDLNLQGNASGGFPPYTFQWTGPNSFSSTIQNPTISSVTILNEGTYILTVTDSFDCFDTGSIFVAVLEAPLVTFNPESDTVFPGGTASFTVSGTGDGLTYQWQVNTGSGFSNMPGEISPNLIVTGITSGMDGNLYRCIISGTCLPPDTSTSATLRVAIATTGVDTFYYTGIEETFTVPPLASSITADVWGSQGGHATYGGQGAYLKVIIPVTPGEVLDIYAGAMGSCCGTYGSGEGGEASYIARGITPCVVSAGGGGGCGDAPWTGGEGSATTSPTVGERSSYSYGWGTPGSGGNGGGAGAGSWGTGGGGGWYSAGGNGSGTPGGAAKGKASMYEQWVGGAGGGYNGAGGSDMESGWGQASGGGGGSYYTGTLISSSSGVRTGNGLVIISW